MGPGRGGWQGRAVLLPTLLLRAKWDEAAVRDGVLAYARERLGEGGVLVVDETGFLKKGDKLAGVARQYTGTAGRIENCQVGVFLAYETPRGHALVDRELYLYLPEEWTRNKPRCQEAGVPDEVPFRTKTQLAHAMLLRAFEAGLRPSVTRCTAATASCAASWSNATSGTCWRWPPTPTYGEASCR